MVPALCGQLVGSRGEIVRLFFAELREVDHPLGMLYSESDRERFCLHGDTVLEKSRKSIPGGMACRGDQNLAGNRLSAGELYARHCSVPDHEMLCLCPEPHGTAEPPDLLPHPGDDTYQAVCSHVGLLLPEDLPVSTEADKGLQHLPVPSAAVLYHGVQFSVAEGPRAAFPEGDIALGVQFPCLPEVLHADLPLFCRQSPFQDQGTIPLLRKEKSCKQPRRARADNDRTVRQFFLSGDRRRVDFRRGRGDLRITVPLQDLMFLSCLYVHRIDPPDVVLLSCIQGALHDLEGKKLLFPDMQKGQDLFFQILRPVTHRKRYRADSDRHRFQTLPASFPLVQHHCRL